MNELYNRNRSIEIVFRFCMMCYKLEQFTSSSPSIPKTFFSFDSPPTKEKKKLKTLPPLHSCAVVQTPQHHSSHLCQHMPNSPRNSTGVSRVFFMWSPKRQTYSLVVCYHSFSFLFVFPYILLIMACAFPSRV